MISKKLETCFFCQNPSNNLTIKEFRYWNLELHKNQDYLGRCVLVLRRHLVDLFEISEFEREELFLTMENIKHALINTFNPDHFNYASLGNEERHLHLHIIPRYSKPVKFMNNVFVDRKWGKNPYPYDKTFLASSEVYSKIVEQLRKSLI